MPALRPLIPSMAFFLLALLLIQFSTATPVAAHPAPPAPDCPTPTLPLSGDATELPPVPPAQTLLYVTLGRGVQNYTCAAPSATPVAIGAVATLFDATALARDSESLLNALPPFAVYMPLNALPAPISSLLTIGHHFFGADGTPTFDLTAKTGKIIFGLKTGDIKAPACANTGPAGTGAVDWLQLVAKPGAASVGIETVYRVVTAGGDPPATCRSAGVIEVQYAAEYWFYGP